MTGLNPGVGTDAADADLDLRRYGRGLLRRKFTVLGMVVVAVAAAIGFSELQSVKYEAQAQVVLEPVTSPSLFNQSTPPQTDPQVSVDTEIQVIESAPVRAAVAHQLGPVAKAVASRVGQTVVIAVHGFAASGPRAAQVADAYAQAYLDLAKSRSSEQLLSAADQIQRQIDGIQTQLDTLDQRLAATPTSQQSALIASRTALASEEDSFRQQLAEVQVEAALTTGGAHLVANALTPSSPVQPKPIRNAVLAAVAGLMLGVGLACLAEFLDDTIRTIDDVERFRPLPLLATVPVAPDRASRRAPQLALAGGRATPATEAYRTLRTAVQLLGVVRPITTIQLTSAAPSEGKTTTAANLATVLADAGRRVALVDCDLRRPMLHTVFGLSNEVGLTSVLLGDAPVASALQQAADFPGLSVLTSGAEAPNPSELLSLRQTAEIIYGLQSMFDLVVLDSPPLLPVTDAVVLSQWVEGVIVVTAGGTTKRKSLRRAIQLLRQTGAPIAGIVLNRAAPEPGYTYRYSYGEPRGRAAGGPRRHGREDHDRPSRQDDGRRPGVEEAAALSPSNGHRPAAVEDVPR